MYGFWSSGVFFFGNHDVCKRYLESVWPWYLVAFQYGIFTIYYERAEFLEVKGRLLRRVSFPLARNPAARYPVVSHDAAMLNYTVPFTSPSNWTLPDHSNQQTNVQANFTATASAAPSGEPSPHPQHPYLNCGPAARRHCRALPGASGRPRTPRFEHDYFPPPTHSSLSLPLYKILATGFLISFLLRGWGRGRGVADIRPRWRNLLSVPLFGVILAGSAAAIFNYQRSSSSVVASTLYALRVHSRGRELLGDGISFRSKVPWIRGTLDQFHGVIDISYAVKGSAGEGVMHFKSVRKERMGLVGSPPPPPGKIPFYWPILATTYLLFLAYSSRL